MKKTIDINGKQMTFEATAMTDHMADHIFGINMGYAVQHAQENQEQVPELIRMMAFIMYKRAELGSWKEVENLTKDDYYDWLDSLDSYEIELNGKEIMDLYVGQKKTSVIPKNTKSPQAE